MSEFERRLTTHLAQATDTVGGNSTAVEEIMHRGTNRRARRTALIGIVSIGAVAATAVGAAQLLSRDETNELASRPGGQAATPWMLDPAPSSAQSAFVWDAAESDRWSTATPSNVVSLSVHGSPNVYGLTTMPRQALDGDGGPPADATTTSIDAVTTGTEPDEVLSPTSTVSVNGNDDDAAIVETTAIFVGDEPVFNADTRQQLTRSTDGVVFEPIGEPLDDLRLSALADDGDRTIYGLGTAPAANGGQEVVSAISDNGGESFDVTPFPIDLDVVREQVGWLSLASFGLVRGNGTLVATVTPTVPADVNSSLALADLLPDGVDGSFGGYPGPNGFEVFGPPDDLDGVAARLCPTRWTLTDDAALALNIYNLSTSPEHQTNDLSRFEGGWHCLSPQDDPKSPIWVDPAQIHGDVVTVVPYDQMTASRDLLLAVQRQPRMFHSTDGTSWTEATVPTLEVQYNGQLAFHSSRFIASFVTSDGTTDALISTDGTSWEVVELPEQLSQPVLGETGDGTLVAIGRQGVQLATYHSTDGGLTWQGASLDAMLGLERGMVPSMYRLAEDDGALAVMAQFYGDPVAQAGGVEVAHDRFTLRVLDGNGTLVLLDAQGEALDTTQWWTGVERTTGWLRPSPSTSMIDIVDPASGEVYDTFRPNELNDLTNEIWEDPANQQQQPITTIVFDTVDGLSWAFTGTEQFGVGGVNSYPTGTFLSAAGPSFNFFLQAANGAPLSIALTGRRT